jgi:hypothetical protein
LIRKGKWDIESVLENFKEEMIEFVSEYFGDDKDFEGENPRLQ